MNKTAPNRHHPVTPTFTPHTAWRTLLSMVLIIVAALCGINSGQAAADAPEPAEATHVLSTVDRRQSEDIQALRDRLTFLEEQHGSILDGIAQRIVLGGYGALRLETFSGTDVTFDGLFEVIISGQIHDRIRIYNELDLGVPSGEAEAEQAYVDFLLAKWINLRGGVLLIPFGKVNLDHFDPRRDLTDFPLVARQIVPTVWSDLGVSIFGLVPLSDDIKATYEIAVINGLTNMFSPTDGGLRSAEPELGRDNNGDKAVVGRVRLKLADQYEVGVSAYRGAADPNNGTDITGIGADLEFKPRGIATIEDFEMKGEFAHFDIHGSTTPSRLYGYYLQLNYHFWPPVLDETFLGEHLTNPTFTLVGRYGRARIQTTAGIGNLSQERITIGLNYRPIEDYVIKTEYQFNTGDIERKEWNGFIASISWLF